MAVAPDAVHRVEHVESWSALPEPDGPVAFLAQTTLARRRVAGPARRGPGALAGPVGARHLRPVLCHHQPPDRPQGHRRPLRRRGRDRLGQLVQHPGPGAHRRRRRLPPGAAGQRRRRAARRPLGTVGVIAGASAPEELVQAVVARLAPAGGVEEVRAVDEDEYFPLPRELRDAVRHLAAGRGGGRPGARAATRPPAGRRCPMTASVAPRWRWPA